MDAPVLPSATHKRQRASIACRSCNTKRIKCNAATAGLPCANCQRTGENCRLIESRRGKRRSPRNDVVSGEAEHQEGTTQRSGNQVVDDRTLDDREDLSNSEPISKLPTHNAGNIVPATNVDDSTDQTYNDTLEIQERSDVLFPHMLGADDSRQHLTKSDEFLSPFRETFSLGYLLHQTWIEREAVIEDEGSLQYPIPYNANCLLQSQKVFEIPKSHICLALFKTFFEFAAPQYPILDRASFLFQYAIPHRPPSWLLLQAVLFMAAGHCDKGLLKEAGFDSRYHARLILFKRTKALYDADHEKDKVTIVQAVFLMSFSWATPLETKDTWHWLGIAINLALTIGMHRSNKDSNVSLKQQRLWKGYGNPSTQRTSMLLLSWADPCTYVSLTVILNHWKFQTLRESPSDLVLASDGACRKWCHITLFIYQVCRRF